MTASQGIWFVYRSPSEGPLGKRVRRLPAPSILAWFQARVEEARIALDPARCADVELGGPVHGLGAVFDAVKKQSLHTPKSTAALTKLLKEHLHEDGGSDDVRVDAHSVRVIASGEEGESAFFFFDDDALRRMPRNLTYMLHDEARLPEGDVAQPFASVPVQAITPAGEKEGTTYACLLTSHGRRTLTGRAVSFAGVRLPELAAHLRSVTPAPDGAGAWPLELRVLRAMLDAGDTQLAPALRRAAAYPLDAVTSSRDHAVLGAGAHDAARAEIAAAAEGLKNEGDPAQVVVSETEHAALLSLHASPRLGHQQWILFDDRWAAAHPELATSILHYTEQADPFTQQRAATRPTAPAEKAAPASAAGKAGKAPSKARSKAKASQAASKDEANWKAAVGDRDEATALGYRPTLRFGEGNLITHAKFGVGVVTRAEGTKCEILFKDGPRIMVHGASA